MLKCVHHFHTGFLALHQHIVTFVPTFQYRTKKKYIGLIIIIIIVISCCSHSIYSTLIVFIFYFEIDIGDT